MSVIAEPPGFKARGNILAVEALAAQLNILQLFLPLDGWLVAWLDGEAWDALASRGVFEAAPVSCLAALLDAGEPPPDDYFQWRVLTEAESILLQPYMSAHTGYLVLATLRDAEGRKLGRICGFSGQPPGSRLSLCVGKLQLCQAAMAATLALQDELGVADQLVIEMQRDAFIDPLTGVFNRAGWINRLAYIDAVLSRTQEDAAVIMLDLDFLKVVNDTCGHSAGDDLLRLAAQTISSTLRSSDSVGRLGGDEFGVVVQNATPVGAAVLLSRLRQALAKVGVKISLGMALKSESGSLKQAMQLADERMYIEKRKKPAPIGSRQVLQPAPAFAGPT